MTDYKMDLGGALAVAIDGLNKILNAGLANDFMRQTAVNKEYPRPKALAEAHKLINDLMDDYLKWIDAIEDLVMRMSGGVLVDVRTHLQSEWELAKSNNSTEANEILYKNLISQLPYPADESEDKPEKLDDK